MYTWDGKFISEATINYKIASCLKEELEKTYRYKVYVTRTEEQCPELEERVEYAKAQDADVLVSLHINSSDGESVSKPLALVARKGTYHPKNAEAGQTLAVSIMEELQKLGYQNDYELMERPSTDGTTYEDGQIADYYAIIKHGQKLNVPAIIVEHGFINNEYDYRNYFSSDDKIKELAKADARGIVNSVN